MFLLRILSEMTTGAASQAILSVSTVPVVVVEDGSGVDSQIFFYENVECFNQINLKYYMNVFMTTDVSLFFYMFMSS